MYKCEKCKKQIRKNIPQLKLFKTRSVKFEGVDGLFIEGTQIEAEKNVCSKCFDKGLL